MTEQQPRADTATDRQAESRRTAAHRPQRRPGEPQTEPRARTATARWFESRLPVWHRLEKRLGELEQHNKVDPQTILQTVRLYPELARDLAIARREAPGGRLTRHLSRIYARLHQTIFRAPVALGPTLKDLFTRQIPIAIADLKWRIAGVTAFFIACAAAGWWLVARFPELVWLFASRDMIDSVREGTLWTEGLLNVMPSSMLSITIFTNNIVVTFTAVSFGALYGLGTLYIMGLNGLMLGSLFAFTASHGLAGELFTFICAHGFVELAVICIGGAVGFSIGESLARPGSLPRRLAFQRACAKGGRVLVLCVVFLIGAGLIEGFISPDPRFPLGVRLAIGLGYLALLLYALAGFPLLSRLRRGGRGARASDPPLGLQQPVMGKDLVVEFRRAGDDGVGA